MLSKESDGGGVKAVGRSATASRLKEPLLADSSAPRSNAAASEAERATRRDERLAVVGVVVVVVGRSWPGRSAGVCTPCGVSQL